MNLLIVVAHPDTEHSHNRYIYEEVKRRMSHVDYKCIDLYEEEFNPVLFQEDEAQKQRYQDLVAWSTHLVIIYPIWWNGPPAILKGFFDQVIEADFAFKFDPTPFPKVGWPRGFLNGRRAAVLTTSGSPTWMHYLYQRRRGIKNVTKDTLSYCGVTTKNFHLGGAQRLDETNKHKIKRMVTDSIQWLTS